MEEIKQFFSDPITWWDLITVIFYYWVITLSSIAWKIIKNVRKELKEENK